MTANPGMTVLREGDGYKLGNGDISDAARQTAAAMDSDYQIDRFADSIECEQRLAAELQFDSSPSIFDGLTGSRLGPLESGVAPINAVNPMAPTMNYWAGPHEDSELRRYSLLAIGGLAGAGESLFDTMVKAPVVALGTVVGSGLHRILPGELGEYFSMHTENLGEALYNTKEWATSDHPLDPIFASVDARLNAAGALNYALRSV